MTPLCTDAAAYQAIPDEFLECIMTRRHSWPPRARQRPQRVRLHIDGTREALELVEYYADCVLCGCTRTLFRHFPSGDFAWAEYVYRDGYCAPAGSKWDPEIIRDEYRRRNPVRGKVKVVRR